MTERIETTILRNLLFTEEYYRKVVPFLKADYFTEYHIIFKKLNIIKLTMTNHHEPRRTFDINCRTLFLIEVRPNEPERTFFGSFDPNSSLPDLNMIESIWGFLKERIEKRLQRIESELSYKSNFDYSIVNDKLEDATNKILDIIQNEIEGVHNVT